MKLNRNKEMYSTRRSPWKIGIFFQWGSWPLRLFYDCSWFDKIHENTIKWGKAAKLSENDASCNSATVHDQSDWAGVQQHSCSRLWYSLPEFKNEQLFWAWWVNWNFSVGRQRQENSVCDTYEQRASRCQK